MACGSPVSSPVDPTPTGPASLPAGAVSWGFFEYTRDFAGGLTNARLGRQTGLVWTVMEPVPGTGNYDWSDLDIMVRNAQSAGQNVVFELKTGNGAAFSEPDCFRRVDGAAPSALPMGRRLASCPIRPDMETAWGRMIGEVVERYDGDGTRDMPGFSRNIRVDLEVENEAANSQLWDYGTNDRTLAADRYLRLLALSYQAKQAANPDTQVILAGLFEPNLLARCDRNPGSSGCTPTKMQNVAFSKRILSRPEIFDGVDVHFFAYYHFEPDFVDAGLGWVIDQMQQRGYQRPIYSLEWTAASMLHVNFEGYDDEFRVYFPYSASFPGNAAFYAMYAALDQPGNVTYRKWFEAEQAKEFPKLFTNMLAGGVRRLVHVQYSDYFQGASWSNVYWNWQGIIKYVGGAPIRKPSYYTSNILSERIFGFTAARRIGQGDVRLYEFTFPTGDPTYVLWTDGPNAVVDLSPVVPRSALRVTPLVTELDGANAPVVRPEQTVPTTAVPVGDVPVLLKGV